jgi:hypothetical protein
MGRIWLRIKATATTNNKIELPKTHSRKIYPEDENMRLSGKVTLSTPRLSKTFTSIHFSSKLKIKTKGY